MNGPGPAAIAWRLTMRVTMSAALLLPCALTAQQDSLRLDLAAVRRHVVETSPIVAEARAALAAALGAQRQARGYAFNPQLELKVPSLLDPGDSAPFEGLVTQELEWAGQWGLRRTAAARREAAAEAGFRNAVRQATLAGELAFLEAAAARRRHEVLARGADLAEGLRAAVTGRFAEGEVSQMDLNLARISAGRARAEERRARFTLQSASLELARILGLPTDPPLAIEVTDAPDSRLGQQSLAELVERALAARPDLRGSQANLEAATSLRRLATRQGIPNIRIAAVATRSIAGDAIRWGLRFGIPLPLWNRGGGLRQQAVGEEDMARAVLSGAELDVRTEVAAAYERYTTAQEELALYAEEVLAPAQQNEALLRTAYDEGETGLATTLLLQVELLQAELGYWDAWLMERSARAHLEAAVGGAWN